MKLNEVHFTSGTVITHFLDQPYQEINFNLSRNKFQKSLKQCTVL